MRKLCFVAALLVVLAGYSQETFTVLFVKGEVKIGDDSVERGTKISATDELKYATEQDMIAAISPSRGRVILKPQPDKAKPNGELAFVVKDIFLPVKSNAMTRAVGDEIGFANDFVVQAYFERGKFALLDTTAITFDTEEYLLDQTHYFSVKYQKGSNDVLQTLPYALNKVLVIPSQLFDGVNTPGETTLSLQYNDGVEVRKVADLQVVIPDFNVLKEEIAIIKNSGMEYPWNEVSSYVESMYGFTDQSRLQEIYRSLP